MIPDFKTYLKESIWSDIQDRSSGDVVRKEDNLDNLDSKGMSDYIKKNYIFINGGYTKVIDFQNEYDTLYVASFFSEKGGNMYCLCYCYDTNVIFLNNLVKFEYEKLFNMINEKFFVIETENVFEIYPEKNQKPSNSFFIKLLNMIIDFIPEQYLVIRKKESH